MAEKKVISVFCSLSLWFHRGKKTVKNPGWNSKMAKTPKRIRPNPRKEVITIYFSSAQYLIGHTTPTAVSPWKSGTGLICNGGQNETLSLIYLVPAFVKKSFFFSLDKRGTHTETDKNMPIHDRWCFWFSYFIEHFRAESLLSSLWNACPINKEFVFIRGTFTWKTTLFLMPCYGPVIVNHFK